MIVCAVNGKIKMTIPIAEFSLLNVTTFEEDESLSQSDTAIKEGLLDYYRYNWYGSAALPTHQ